MGANNGRRVCLTLLRDGEIGCALDEGHAGKHMTALEAYESLLTSYASSVAAVVERERAGLSRERHLLEKEIRDLRALCENTHLELAQQRGVELGLRAALQMLTAGDR